MDAIEVARARSAWFDARRLAASYLFGVVLVGAIAATATWALWSLFALASELDVSVLRGLAGLSDWSLAQRGALAGGVGLLVCAAVVATSLRALELLAPGGAALALRLGARHIDETNALHRRLRDVLEEAAASVGVAVPSLFVHEDLTINAFSVGDRPAIAAIVVTRGALERLDRAQLQAVLTQQLVTIAAGYAGIQLRATIAMTGLCGLQLYGRRLASGRGSAEQPVAPTAVPGALARSLGAALGLLGLPAALAGRMLPGVLDPARVLQADSMSVRISGDPDSLRSVLRKVLVEQRRDGGGGPVAVAGVDSALLAAHCMFVQPRGVSDLADSHPPLSDRVQRLRWSGWRHEPVDGQATPHGVNAADAGAAPEDIGGHDLPAADPEAGRTMSRSPAAPLVRRLRAPELGFGEMASLMGALVADLPFELSAALTEPAPTQASDAVRWLLGTDGRALRIPVLELLLARANRGNLAERREMLERCRIGLGADAALEPTRWLRYALAQHRLLGRIRRGAAAQSPRIARDDDLRARSRALAALFALAAAAGEASLRRTRDGIAACAADLAIAPPLTAPDVLDGADVALALETMARLAPDERVILLKSIAAMARVPGSADFEAFLRALAAALDCPVTVVDRICSEAQTDAGARSKRALAVQA